MLVAAGLLMTPLRLDATEPAHKARITALFDQPPADRQPSKEAYHLHQAKRMFALGGAVGEPAGRPADRGPGRLSPARGQDRFHLLRGQGAAGAAGVGPGGGAYGLLAWRGLAIAADTREPFGRLVAVGVTAMISLQAVINMGMNLGLLPVTGCRCRWSVTAVRRCWPTRWRWDCC